MSPTSINPDVVGSASSRAIIRDASIMLASSITSRSHSSGLSAVDFLTPITAAAGRSTTGAIIWR